MNIRIGMTYVGLKEILDGLFEILQAIHGYRETEKSEWTSENQQVLTRIRQFAFDDPTKTLVHVHVLDIAKDGYIKPHIDSIRVGAFV